MENLERLLPSQAHVAVIRSLTCVNTERGKGRAWLRLALNEKSLSDCLQALIDDPVVMRFFSSSIPAPIHVLPPLSLKTRFIHRKWHNESALLRHPEDSAFLISLLGGLSAIDFDLSLDEPWLDRESSMIRCLFVLPASLYLPVAILLQKKPFNKEKERTSGREEGRHCRRSRAALSQ